MINKYNQTFTRHRVTKMCLIQRELKIFRYSLYKNKEKNKNE